MARTGPGLYSEIGRQARDLLYRDYQTDQKFTLSTVTADGIAITTSGTRKIDDNIIGEIQSRLKANKNVTVDVKATSNANLFTTVTIDELATPGLKSIFSFVVPDQKSGKVELQYLHDYAGVSASIGLTANPIVNLSSVFGTKALAVGADVALDTATGNFTKYNAGVNVTLTDAIASLVLNNKGDTLTGSYYHLKSPLTNTAFGAEMTHHISTNENSLTFGVQHALDPLTLVKARISNNGKTSALIQHQFRPGSFATISSEVDTKAIEKSSKVGVSIALRP